jgi:hypothetical protein
MSDTIPKWRLVGKSHTKRCTVLSHLSHFWQLNVAKVGGRSVARSRTPEITAETERLNQEDDRATSDVGVVHIRHTQTDEIQQRTHAWCTCPISRDVTRSRHARPVTKKRGRGQIATGETREIGLDDGCSNGVPPIHFFQEEHKIQFRSRPARFLGFSNHEKGAPTQEISKWSTVCSTFSRNGWSVVGSASLAKGGIS